MEREGSDRAPVGRRYKKERRNLPVLCPLMQPHVLPNEKSTAHTLTAALIDTHTHTPSHKQSDYLDITNKSS